MIVIGASKARQKQNHMGKSYRYPKWKIYYYDENGSFKTKYLKGRLEAGFWKAKIQSMNTYECNDCGLRYRSNIGRCPVCQNQVPKGRQAR